MPAASVNFLLPFKDLGCVDILQRSAYIASGPAAVTLVAGLVALALGGPAERYLAEAIRGQFAPDLLNLISVVSLGLVGLSGIAPRWRGYRDVGLLIAAGTAGVTFDYLSFAIGVLLGLFPVAVADKGFLWAVATVLPTVALLVAFQWASCRRPPCAQALRLRAGPSASPRSELFRSPRFPRWLLSAHRD